MNCHPPTPTLASVCAESIGLLCMLTDRIDAALMDAAGSNLKVISQMAVGYDNIDVKAARQRKIALGNTPGVLTETTADLAFALLLASARRLVEGVRYIQDGKWITWHPTTLLGHDVTGATLGLVGLGAHRQSDGETRGRLRHADPRLQPASHRCRSRRNRRASASN